MTKDEFFEMLKEHHAGDDTDYTRYTELSGLRMTTLSCVQNEKFWEAFGAVTHFLRSIDATDR